MDSKAMESILSQLRATTAMAQTATKSAKPSGTEGFAQTLRNAVDSIDAEQNQAQAMADTQASGRSQIDVSQIMVALEKADLSFQTMVEVRNKLVSAYQEIMNLQV